VRPVSPRAEEFSDTSVEMLDPNFRIGVWAMRLKKCGGTDEVWLACTSTCMAEWIPPPPLRVGYPTLVGAPHYLDYQENKYEGVVYTALLILDIYPITAYYMVSKSLSHLSLLSS